MFDREKAAYGLLAMITLKVEWILGAIHRIQCEDHGIHDISSIVQVGRSLMIQDSYGMGVSPLYRVFCAIRLDARTLRLEICRIPVNQERIRMYAQAAFIIEQWADDLHNGLDTPYAECLLRDVYIEQV